MLTIDINIAAIPVIAGSATRRLLSSLRLGRAMSAAVAAAAAAAAAEMEQVDMMCSSLSLIHI